jgi:capsular polysaccharide transport system ATP-binding protein
MLELHKLTKWYPSAHGRKYVFRELDLALPEGTNLALIGRNGAGKSTLVNLLGGIDSPNAGAVLTDRRISWPVGLRGGLQGSLSARENVQFVCRVYGATGRSMRQKLDFIEDFAELGDYFNLPVRSYSAGMRSRLSFGLSMAFDFDIYLIDEVMAVGDSVFKRKSHAVMSERLRSANLILVSHSMAPVRAYCNKVLLLERGKVTVFDDVEAGIAAYQQTSSVPAAAPAAT